jgi:hypothetical protein
VDALGLIGQLLDKMIPAQRIVPLKPKNAPGYYVLNESEIDRYVRRSECDRNLAFRAKDLSSKLPAIRRKGEVSPLCAAAGVRNVFGNETPDL